MLPKFRRNEEIIVCGRQEQSFQKKFIFFEHIAFLTVKARYDG
jgi:hypothetical protein